MDTERVKRARFAAEVRRKGTLLSDEAVEDVCEALLELIDGGVITLELHRQIVDQVRVSARRRAHAELEAVMHRGERD